VSDLRAVARALGGEVAGRNVLCPGPGHSPGDRSLSVMFNGDGSFVCHSFAGDDPIACKDYVSERLGLPSWEPGDEQDRTVPSPRINDFDQAALNQESKDKHRTEDAAERIERARRIWDEAGNPRGTAAEAYLQSRALDLPDDLAGGVLRV
jgi:putative DNA primase/helicase